MDTLTFVLIVTLVLLLIESIRLKILTKRVKNLEEKSITTDKLEGYQKIHDRIVKEKFARDDRKV